MFLGALHLLALGVQNAHYLDEWFTGELWLLPRADFVTPHGAAGAFWISLGSFAVPMTVLGALLADLGRRGITVPAWAGWALGGWALVGAAVVEPTPMLLVLVPAGLLVRAAGAARRSGVAGAAGADGAAGAEGPAAQERPRSSR
ncbi:hypothetical protein GPJ59_21100 [Streptomyces bambusae]|uniref:MFS transporter n=2 Tax=Streptomyces bambusae TaxID=1550616 RepID=A0ABS6ZCB4_9ACTN|nr:hypothetical protein [Streptomyces bambusae]